MSPYIKANLKPPYITPKINNFAIWPNQALLSYSFALLQTPNKTIIEYKPNAKRQTKNPNEFFVCLFN